MFCFFLIVSHQLDEATRALTKAEVQIKTCEKTIAKAEKSVAKQRDELAALEQDLETKTAEFKALEDEAFEVQKKFTDLQNVAFSCQAFLAGFSLPCTPTIHCDAAETERKEERHGRGARRVHQDQRITARVAKQ